MGGAEAVNYLGGVIVARRSHDDDDGTCGCLLIMLTGKRNLADLCWALSGSVADVDHY